MNKRVVLNDGRTMPCIGFGCFRLPADRLKQVIESALDAGYRYFDSATRYENELAVGLALRQSGVPRASLHVVSKLWPTSFHEARRGIEYSLSELNLDYIDGYYLHWPGITPDMRYRAWEVMLEMQQRGLIQSVGVSNFTIGQLEDLIARFGVRPTVNQIEIHPWYPEQALADWCKAHGIQVASWSPVFRGRAVTEPVLARIGAAYGKTGAQAVLRWHVEKGYIPLPKSSDPGRLKENFDIFDFSLSSDDAAAIASLENGEHLGDDPETFDGGTFMPGR